MEKKFSKHWVVVILAALLAGGSVGIVMNTMGVFFPAVSSGLNVLQGEFALHATFNNLGFAFTSFFVAGVLKRFDFRLVILVATIITAGATALMGFSTQMWQFYLLGFIRGVAMAFYAMVPLNILITNWFSKQHGLATSLVFSFSGVTGAIFSPIFASIIANQGWERAYLFNALALAALSLPALLVPFKLDPRDEGLEPYGYVHSEATITTGSQPLVKERVNYASYIFIGLVTIAMLTTSISALNQHLTGIGLNLGYEMPVAAAMVSACMVGNIIFKLLIGIISDWKGPFFATMSMTVLNIISLFMILFSSNTFILYLGSFLFGSIFAVTAVGQSILSKYFFVKNYQTVMPLVTFISGVGIAVAISVIGYSYDFTGSYYVALVACLIFHAIVVFLLITMQMKKKAEEK